uniref:Uncharacterized protein n=1 Tax=Anguilla anguilla TaxID=7936 RepID=A0A0E9PIM1_ANGAN
MNCCIPSTYTHTIKICMHIELIYRKRHTPEFFVDHDLTGR